MANDIVFFEGFPSGSTIPGMPQYVSRDWGSRVGVPFDRINNSFINTNSGRFLDLQQYGFPVIDQTTGQWATAIDGAFSEVITYETLESYSTGATITLYDIPIGNYNLKETLTISSRTNNGYTWTTRVAIKVTLNDAATDTVQITYRDLSNLLLIRDGSGEGYLHNMIVVGSQYATTMHDTPIDYNALRDAVLSMFILHYDRQIAGSNLVLPYFPTSYSVNISGSEGSMTAKRYFDREEIGYNSNGRLEVSDYTLFISMNSIYNRFDVELVSEEMSPEAGPPSDEDGMNTPSFDDSSDTIDIPADPTIGVTNVGFVNVYKTGSASLQNMGVELFPPLQYTAPTPISSGSTTDAIIDGFNAIVTFLANIPSFFDQSVAATLINYIIDCHVIPVNPTGGTLENIKVGYKTLSSSGYRMSTDYVSFDCGSINLGEYYENFADFLTSAKLYLPFVGFVPARPEWFYRDSLNITYKFNIIDGSFVAYVRSSGRYVNNNNSGKTVVAQYSGNACVHLPITGVTYSNMVSGLIGSGAGAIMSAGSGNVAGVATSALNAANLHGDMPNSNSYTASGSFLTIRRPFLMIERPVSNFSKTYAKEMGIPSNISKKLSNVSGFSMIGDVHLDGINATDQEKIEIEKLLHEGVIL